MAERIWTDWRALGHMLGLTNNRMDMLEMEANGLMNDATYKMLQAWRDEDNGKVSQHF